MASFLLKARRKQLGLSLQDLADKTNLTRSYLSKVERGVRTPTIAVALRIAKALHVDVQELFSEEKAAQAVLVVRAKDRLPIDPKSDSESRYEVIPNNAVDARQHTFIVRPTSDFSSSDFRQHDGQELVFVHKGRIEIAFNTDTVRLVAGDAVQFDAQTPHKMRAIRGAAEVLVVITENGAH